MKKIFAIILILAMLVPFVVACGGENETTTTTTTENTATDGSFSSKNTVKKDWEGETLLVAATAWHAKPAHPWSAIELVIKEGETSAWGENIDKAVLERTAFIKKTYGVDVVWEWASRYNTHDVLKNAILAGNDPDYDLAMPRNFRAQAIVANGSVYDMANRSYIDFNNSYYNQDSIETYTAKGHTFFIVGDFSFADEESCYVIVFNKAMLGEEEEVNKLYQLVRDGKWTYDKLVAYTSSVWKDDDGNGRKDPEDTYGIYLIREHNVFEYSGVKQAGVDETTGEWKITLNDPKVNDIIDNIIELNTAVWSRDAWAGMEYTYHDCFADNKILFMDQHLEDVEYIYKKMQSNGFGVIPFPKLNEEQDRYYVTGLEQIQMLMCVPKTTSDRNMSDYFVDVLSWTGSEYVMKAYYEQKSEVLGDQEMKMIKEYIVPNISYDAGAAVGWSSLMGGVLNYAYDDNENTFDAAYAEYEADALRTIKEWNEAWGSYTE